MKKLSFFCSVIFWGILLFIFRGWFFHSEIIGGDWPYYFDGFLRDFPAFPTLWTPWLGNGLGGINPVLGLQFFSSLLIVPFVQMISLSWVFVYKLFWFGLFILLSVFGSKKLMKEIAPSIPEMGLWIASLIYTSNTYILMVTSGGQMGVALAYAITPWVFIYFRQLVRDLSVRSMLAAGFVWGAQLVIDPRIAYVAAIGVGLYALVFGLQTRRMIRTICFMFFPALLGILLNAFWIIPMIVMKNNPLEALGAAYTTVESLRFFSFADFSHAWSMLHPNWPENIFGKTYFMQPEFLVFPILAYACLFRLRQVKKHMHLGIIFFSFLGIAGAFLSKGAREPFGQVFVWMFERIPGFVMFRDPTKFYVLTIVAYSVLIPLTVYSFVKKTSIYRHVAAFIFILFFLFTIRQASLGKLGGTFSPHAVPSEYIQLADFLEADTEFFRTLWVPRQQRFAYADPWHLPVEAEPLFSATTAAELKSVLDTDQSLETIRALSIKYIIVPYDSLGELFLSDRQYDEQVRGPWIEVLDSVSWLKKITDGRLTVYQTANPHGLFHLESGEPVDYKKISNDRYHVSFLVTKSTVLYFSQNFHTGWVLESDGKLFHPSQDFHGLTRFEISEPGEYSALIYFEPQRWVNIGALISGVTLLFICFSYVWAKNRDPHVEDLD